MSNRALSCSSSAMARGQIIQREMIKELVQRVTFILGASAVWLDFTENVETWADILGDTSFDHFLW